MYPRANPTDIYCLDAFHHLSWAKLSDIRLHLNDFFAGPAGTRYNDWFAAVEQAGVSLGRLYMIIGSGTGVAQIEVESVIGIFKYL